MQLRKTLLLALSCLVLAGCGEGPSNAAAAAETLSRSLQPTDPAIAAIYQRSCRNCHTIAATSSPLTGDSAAWEPRMAKGMDTLLDNVINGFGGMPSLGMCMDCEVEEFEALIQFMATAKTSEKPQ